MLTVNKVLPSGCKVKHAASIGASFWAISHKITVTVQGGGGESYFLKLYMHERGQEMAQGEFESTKIWHQHAPENVPRPIGIGECANRPGRFFCLLEFRDMVAEMPVASDLVSIIAKVHECSLSPTGKFGFSIKTFAGDHPYVNGWCDTWEEYFTRLMVGTMERELLIQGPHEELELLSKQVIDKVIPRLLRPMETGGRNLKPSLVHGDLWHGNIQLDKESGKSVLYDCGSFYGHNEYDLGMWRAERYLTNKSHAQAYFHIAGISHPLEDVDDRNALYAA
ncbi:Fructosamine/Ketosamine-3-kinase [Microdochium bolleyi]|uniref:protein-ribulosamine 3-kinase n=1 Tax=Microdochium bolleyi TaxID=196109 RepID=A0A136IQL1_9PEZI|nr:Fructosamine/Ketosamine-3-kinase [Microdochium bolleyi]